MSDALSHVWLEFTTNPGHLVEAAGELIRWCSTHGSVQADDEWCQSMTLEPLDLDGDCEFVSRLLVEGLDE